MHFKVIYILILVFLSSFSSSSSSSSSSQDLQSSSFSSSLSSIFSLISQNEGSTEEHYNLPPPFAGLLRLLSRDSAGQQESAGIEPLLLRLNNMLSEAKEEIEGRDKLGNGKITGGVEDGIEVIQGGKVEDEERNRRERGETGKHGDGGERRVEKERNEENMVKRLNENKENADRRELEEVVEEEEKEDPDRIPIPPSIINQIKEKIKEILAKLKIGFKHIFGYYVPSNSTGLISEECAIDVDDANFLAHINKFWFLKMYDSWGKFPDGFFFGNMRAAGMHDECIKIQVTNEVTLQGENVTRSYRGRYCSVTYIPNITQGGNESESESESESERRVKSLVLPSVRSGVSLAKLGSPLPFSYGTCVPSTCTAEDVQVSLSGVMAEDNLELSGVYCHSEDEERDEKESIHTGEDKAMVAIFSVFGILVIVATVYDIVVECCGINSIEVVRNFSFLHNLRKLFTYENGKETGDIITCLPMLRVVTMLWIIICHQYETNSSFLSNTFDSLTYQDPVIGQIVTNGWISVDTFFFMAGLIITFRLVPYMRADYKLPTHLGILVSVIIRRIVRLAPVILCVSLFCASLLRFMASGPHAHILESFSQNTCRKHWWKDPLFINNYLFPGNEGDDVNDCLSNCWYTAVDVQLLALLPVIFLPFVYNRVAGVIVLCILSVASVVVPLVITIVNDLPPIPLHHVLGEKRLEYMTHIFLAPWARAGPWVVGVWTGLILRTPRMQRIRMNKIIVFIGYVIAITMGFVLVLGLYPYNHVRLSIDVVEKQWQDHPAVCAIYGALARPTWALCVAWVVFTCHTGNAEIVNRVLSYAGWLPLARLCFAIYIVAPVVQLWWATVQLQPTYFNYLSKLVESSGVFSISLLLGLLLFCFVELPVVQTVNLFLPSPAKKHERAVFSSNNNNNNNKSSSISSKGKESGDWNRLFPMRQV